MERSINGYDPNNLGGAPKTPDYPNGNPNLPYFKLHGSDMPWVVGTLSTLHDAKDRYSEQLVAGYFAEFGQSGQPNPSISYLSVRGYTKSIQAIEKTGPWQEVTSTQGSMKLMDCPAVTRSFLDVPQSAVLNYSLTYYKEGET